ncbi:hypothetical protein WJX81_006410 [Elliptochloris bilobata]|uniref:Fatty acid desaturase domain-containing protein n=1 Tax=Elliptochloris bilobata TaxID=381761 RepID=A0AAW1RW67_9CHLO
MPHNFGAQSHNTILPISSEFLSRRRQAACEQLMAEVEAKPHKAPYADLPPRDITNEELQFLSDYTGEHDLVALRKHVLHVWHAVKAKCWTFGCIQVFRFLQPKIVDHPFFPSVVEAGRSADANQLFMDVGCCFGQELRKLILDGYPEACVVASDLTPDYWNFGLELFKDKGRLRVRTAFGSLTDLAFVSKRPDAAAAALVGAVTYLWAGAVLHVLSKGDAERFVASAHILLAPGGVFFGSTGGSEEAGEWWLTPDGQRKRYLHSPGTLTALLESAGFSDVEVQSYRPEEGSGVLGQPAGVASDLAILKVKVEAPPRELTDDELKFLSDYTGERDLVALRQHVLRVWRDVKAKCWTFKCIQCFRFLQPRIGDHPFYGVIVEASRSAHANQVFMDVGCCFGQETRKLMVDGYPEANIIANDITPDYWNFGSQLFKDQERLRVRTAFGSLADPAFVSGRPDAAVAALVGTVTYLWAGAVLCKPDTERFVAAAHLLLAPGGVFFGSTGGAEEAGEGWRTPDGKSQRYLHSPATLTALLESVGFTGVEVQARRRGCGIASETGLGHVFVSLFPGPLRYTASLLMPLSALLSVVGALYGHHVVGYLAGVLNLAQMAEALPPAQLVAQLFATHPTTGAAVLDAACALAGVAFAFVVMPAGDVLMGRDLQGSETMEGLGGPQGGYRALLYAFSAVHWAVLLAGCAAAPHVHPLALMGLAASLGTGTSLMLTVAHELLHSPRALDKAMCNLLLSAAGYMHWSCSHLAHHRKVATPADAQSARLGESLYAFLPRSVTGSLREGVSMEAARLAARRLPFLSLHNRVLTWVAAPAALLTTVGALWGTPAVALGVAQAVVAVFLLEDVNYVEHYGLTRAHAASGMYVRQDVQHSWNANWLFSNACLFRLQRHSDHHAHAARPYQDLRDMPNAPQLPASYPAMLILALVPPLWSAVMDSRVAALHSKP